MSGGEEDNLTKRLIIVLIGLLLCWGVISWVWGQETNAESANKIDSDSSASKGKPASNSASAASSAPSGVSGGPSSVDNIGSAIPSMDNTATPTNTDNSTNSASSTANASSDDNAESKDGSIDAKTSNSNKDDANGSENSGDLDGSKDDKSSKEDEISKDDKGNENNDGGKDKNQEEVRFSNGNSNKAQNDTSDSKGSELSAHSKTGDNKGKKDNSKTEEGEDSEYQLAMEGEEDNSSDSQASKRTEKKKGVDNSQIMAVKKISKLKNEGQGQASNKANDIAEDKIIKDISSEESLAQAEKVKKEYGVEEDLLVMDKNSITGVYDTIYFTEKDRHRWTMLAKTNANLKRSTNLWGGDLLYGYNLNIFWIEFFASWMHADFREISELPVRSSTNPYAEANSNRAASSKQKLISVGIGPGYRFLVPEGVNIFHLRNLFQTVSVWATYNKLNDSATLFEYDGFGLRADYGIHKRVSSGFHYGIRLGYQLAEVTREQKIPNESASDRKLFLSWMTLALDLGFYF